MLVAASAVYSIFCLVACIKMTLGRPLDPVIAKQGFDSMICATVASCGGMLVNVVTSVWIWLRVGLWKWVLTMTAAFCAVGAFAGIQLGVSPIESLFALCCAFMAAVGVVHGFSYVESASWATFGFLARRSSARPSSLSAPRGVA